MDSPKTTRRKSATRITSLVLGLLFAGNVIAALICYKQPKIYESTGSFTERATPDQSTPVAGAHAATAVSKLELHQRWGVPFDDAVQLVKEGVAIETTASDTIIRARFSSAHDSRMIVEILMSNFPGFERGRQWAQIEDLDGRYTEREKETERQVRQLKKSMYDTLKEAGHFNPGTLVSADTVKRLANKDLSRQFKAYQKMNDPLGRFGPTDGSILIPPPIAAGPYELHTPVSPNIDTYFLVGRVAGLLTAIVALLIIFRYKPSLIESPIRKPANAPALAEIDENATSGPASW